MIWGGLYEKVVNVMMYLSIYLLRKFCMKKYILYVYLVGQPAPKKTSNVKCCEPLKDVSSY